MFWTIKNKIKEVYNKITSGIGAFFQLNKNWDEQTTKKLETILLESEFGSQATKAIIGDLTKKYDQNSENFNPEKHLYDYLKKMITPEVPFKEEDGIYFLCGINGSGKTTSAIKLALSFVNQNKKTLLIAADTFRAAAREQLSLQAEKHGIDIFLGNENDTPSPVVYKGLQYGLEKGYERIIVDTAGRLQNREPLMQELAKIYKISQKVAPEVTKKFLLTLDITIGQNLYDQAELFNQACPLDGLILTKFDALTKPGILFSIVDKLKLPVAYITYGEKSSELSLFDSEEVIKRVLTT